MSKKSPYDRASAAAAAVRQVNGGSNQSNRSLRQRIAQVILAVFQTVLEIIEDKPTFQIPSQVYSILMTLNIFQISGYIFCTGYPKPYFDEKWTTISHVNEYSTGTFLLLVRGIDKLTLTFFVLIEFIIYSYFSYVFILCYIKNCCPYFYHIHKKTFQSINQGLVVFFTFYYWIFLTPFTEISLGILSCNQFAFLAEYRDMGNCDMKPVIWRILGVVGVILSLITNMMILFFFRNYEFFESNLLKRKFSYCQIIVCLSYFMLQYLYYINEIFPSLRYYFAQVMGICMVYDITVNYPFREKTIQFFYIIGTAFFWISHSLMTFWIYDDQYDSNQLFFTFFVFVMFLSYILITIQSHQFESLLRLGPSNFNQFYERIDFYIEQILRFARESSKDESYKFKLFEIIVYHQDNCTNILCACKTRSFRDDKNQIDQEFILSLLQCIFRDSMKKKIIKDNMTELEHLQLKFITFLARFANNPVQAYYELKLFHFTQKARISSYFSVISQVLSSSLQEQITAHQKSKFFATSMSQKPKATISLSAIIQTDQIKARTIPLLASQVSEKIRFWNRLKNGFPAMDDFAQVALDYYHQTKNLKKIFASIFEAPNFKSVAENNAVVIKILSIFKCLVQSEILKSFELEQQVIELKKRDEQKSNFLIHTLNIMNGNVQTIQASLSQDRGRITNILTDHHARFFNQSLSDMKIIKNIKEIMPPYISRIHDSLIENYIERGYSSQLQQGFQSFSLDRTGFLIPVQVNLSSVFDKLDDFCVNAVLLKLVSDKEFLLTNARGVNLGMSRTLFGSLFFHNNQQLFTSKTEDEIIEMKKEFSKISVFLFMPKLIKIIQSYKNAGTNLQKQSMNSMQSFRQSSRHTMKMAQDQTQQGSEQKKSGSQMVIKQDKAIIQIPYNIYDLHIAFQKQNIERNNLQNAILSKQRQVIYEDDFDILELYEDFIGTNIEDWERENCVSTLEVVVNVFVEHLYYKPKERNSGGSSSSSSSKQDNTPHSGGETEMIETYRIEFSEIVENNPFNGDNGDDNRYHNRNQPNTLLDNFQKEFKTVSLDNSQVYKQMISSSAQNPSNYSYNQPTTKKTQFAQKHSKHSKQRSGEHTDDFILDQMSLPDPSSPINNPRGHDLGSTDQSVHLTNFELPTGAAAGTNNHGQRSRAATYMESDRSFLMQNSLTSPLHTAGRDNNQNSSTFHLNSNQQQQTRLLDQESLLMGSPKLTTASMFEDQIASITSRQMAGCLSQDEKGLLSSHRYPPQISVQQKNENTITNTYYQNDTIMYTLNTQQPIHTQASHQQQMQNEILFTIGQIPSQNNDESIHFTKNKGQEMNLYEEEKDRSMMLYDNLRKRRNSQLSPLGAVQQLPPQAQKSKNNTPTDNSSLMIMLNNNNYNYTASRKNSFNNESRLTDENSSLQINSNINNVANTKKSSSTLTAKLKQFLFQKKSIYSKQENNTTPLPSPPQQSTTHQQSPDASFSLDQSDPVITAIQPSSRTAHALEMATQMNNNYTQSEDKSKQQQKSIKNKKGRMDITLNRTVNGGGGVAAEIQQQQQLQQQNEQQQSVSSINQTIRSIDNSLIQQIAHQKHINSSQVINILLYVLSASFCLLSLVYICIFYEFKLDFSQTVVHCDAFKELSLHLSNQTLAQLFVFEANNNLINQSQLDWIATAGFCQSLGQDYHSAVANNFDFINSQGGSGASDDVYSLNIFSNKEYVDISMNLVEVYLETNYAMNKQEISVNKAIQHSELEKMSDQLDRLSGFYFIFSAFVVSIFSLTTFLSMPILKRINEYKEKILLLVSRLNFHECDHEIRKLQTCLSSLSSVYDDWLLEDFVSIITKKESYNQDDEYVQSQGNKRSKKSEGGELRGSKGKRDGSSNNSNNSKKNKSQQFSSMILNQRLSIWRHIVIVFILSLSGATFFGIAIYMSSLKGNALSPVVSVYQDSLVGLQSLQAVILIGEILVRSPGLESAMPEVKELFTTEREVLKAIYNSNLVAIIDFTNRFSATISSGQTFANDEEGVLKALFVNDLCTRYSDDSICQGTNSNNNSLRGVFAAGLMSVLTTYKSVSISYMQLFDGSLTASAYAETITRYTETSEFQEIIVKGFAIPMRAMNLLTELLGVQLEGAATYLFNFVLLYFVIGGSVIGLIWIIACNTIRKRINDDLAGISFSLTCIPFEKSSEDTTIYMLKAIKKM